jgi:hypothetical protein
MTTTEMPYLPTLRTLYDEAITELNPQRGNKLTTPFPASMGNSIFKAICAALHDAVTDTRRMLTVAAACGSYKTSFSYAGVAAITRLAERDPSAPYGVVWLVEQKVQAETAYRELVKLLPGKVRVWTEDHDVSETKSDHITVPNPAARCSKFDLADAPVAIVTQKFYLSKNGHHARTVIRNDAYYQRALTIVDEVPDEDPTLQRHSYYSPYGAGYASCRKVVRIRSQVDEKKAADVGVGPRLTVGLLSARRGPRGIREWSGVLRCITTSIFTLLGPEDALSSPHALGHEAILGRTVQRLALAAHRLARTRVLLALLHKAHLGSTVERLAVCAHRLAVARLRRSSPNYEAGHQDSEKNTPHRFSPFARNQLLDQSEHRNAVLTRASRSLFGLVLTVQQRCSINPAEARTEKLKSISDRGALGLYVQKSIYYRTLYVVRTFRTLGLAI